MRKKNIAFFLTGLYFGFVLSRVGASDFRLIHGFFTGTDFTLAGVIFTAVITAFAGMKLLEIKGKTLRGENISVKRKKLRRFSLIGAALFGLGWGMSGSCPGTALVQAGEGRGLALFTIAGLSAGTWFYAVFFEKKE